MDLVCCPVGDRADDENRLERMQRKKNISVDNIFLLDFGCKGEEVQNHYIWHQK